MLAHAAPGLELKYHPLMKLGRVLNDLLPADAQGRSLASLCPLTAFRPEIVRRAHEEGVDMINDISGGAVTRMFQLAADRQMPYILSHFPEGENPKRHAGWVIAKQRCYPPFGHEAFSPSKLVALQAAGVKDVMLDPGFGFGKRQCRQFWTA